MAFCLTHPTLTRVSSAGKTSVEQAAKEGYEQFKSGQAGVNGTAK